MLLWTKKCRIENKQVFRKLTPVLIHEVRTPIKHTQHLSQWLGNQKMPIGCGDSESEDELKLVDNKCTKSTSQRKTEQTPVRVFLLVFNHCFNRALWIPSWPINKYMNEVMKYEGEHRKIYNELNHAKVPFNRKNYCSYLAVSNDFILNGLKYEWEWWCSTKSMNDEWEEWSMKVSPAKICNE